MVSTRLAAITVYRKTFLKKLSLFQFNLFAIKYMMKIIIVFVLIINYSGVLAQDNSGKLISIGGEIAGTTMKNDSIHFTSSSIDNKYYEDLPIAKITDNKFHVKAKLSYPHLLAFVFESDKKNLILSRDAPLFIDNSTHSMKVDFLSGPCSQVNGRTFKEYQDRFIPFFFPRKENYDCKSNPIERCIHDKSSLFDSKLLDYVLQNPDSYVALWYLIERFSLYGHSELREKTLELFSDKVKNEKLWPIINNDLKRALIKENKNFPVFTIKTQELKAQKLLIPKAQYTLVDFWFSRCRPCLESFPTLKKLYATYQSKGFEIVSVTTDKTEEIPLWKKRIKDYDLPWVQYLDENAIESTKLLVHTFPATFLLNQKGELIKKGISPEELEKFLKANL